MNGLNVDKIYVCHWDKLIDRKEYIINHLNKKGIRDFEFIESYNKENWNIDDIKKEYPVIFNSFAHNSFGLTNIPLKYSEISLVLKHCQIIKDIVDKKYNCCLIFEDDALLHNDFINQFNLYKQQLPQDWDLAWVGSCCGLNAPYTEGKNVYEMDGTRCTHAYAISYSGACKIYPILNTTNDAADWFLNRVIKQLSLKNYWFEPPLAFPNGRFETTIANNIFN
jgi:hypothetical protein